MALSGEPDPGRAGSGLTKADPSEGVSAGILSSDGQFTLTDGPTLPDGAGVVLQKMRSARPAARKLGDGVLSTAPISDGTWLVRFFATPRPDVSLAKRLAALEAEARALAPSQQTAPEQLDAAQELVAAAHRAGVMRKKHRLGWLATEIADLTGAAAVAVIRVDGGKPGRVWFSAGADTGRRGEIVQLVRAAMSDPEAPRMARIRASDTSPEALDAALVAEALEARQIAVVKPAQGDTGHALVLAGADTPAWLAQAPALADLLSGQASRADPSRWLRRAILLGGAAVLTVWLALPAPLILSSQGRAISTETQVIALPFGSFVDEVAVRPGDRVVQGAHLATLSEPDLQAQLSEQEVTLALEEINASAALDSGDYAAFQLSESRSEIARLRIDQLTERLDMLDVRAPVDGIIVDSIASGDRGQFLTTGTVIVRVQPDQSFDVLLDLAPADAPFVETGQTARVRFRGVAAASFNAEVIGVPQQTLDPNTGAISLVVRLRLTDGPQDRLLVGLTGIARINAGEAPRIYGWMRPVISYVRYVAWRHFGLQS